MARVLIVGCGYVGGELGQQLAADGHEVFGLRRDASALPAGIEAIRGDVTQPTGIGRLPGAIDHVVYAVGAKARDEAVYRAVYLDGLANLLGALTGSGQRPRRIFFTSSTSVYGQSAGEWIDEGSPTQPRRFSGQIMLAAERLLLDSSFAATVVRLAGIYGPGRTSMIERVRSGTPIPHEPEPQYTNRIHRDDAAGAIAYLMQQANPAELYIGVDSEPVTRADVLDWLAERLGVRLERAEPETTTRSGSKRCRNARLLSTGYALRYPSFRDGYAELIGAGS